MAKKEQSLIHLRLNGTEAKIAKKDLLASQINTLKILQSLQNYKKLRIEELRKKEKIAIKLKSVKTDITKLQRILPKVKIPQILKHNRTELEEKKPKIHPAIRRYGTVEDQLRKIQEKLKALE